ncbi:TPA: replication initiation protein [Vibrio cholerae]|nr:replication initiation protein [Vibrio cholerae]
MKSTADPILPNLVIDKNPQDISNHIKSHDMVFASLDLSPRMCDILAMLFTRMRAEDWFVKRDIESNIPAQPRYTFTAKEIGQFLLMEPKHVATLLKIPSQKLASLTAGIESDDGGFVYAPLFSKIEYKNRCYTIVPNNELRHSYIARAKSNGYALINNTQYLALKDTNSKKMLDLLSRFKTGNKLYPISIERLQQTFGVISGSGEIKKKSYSAKNRFINLVIEPALSIIANSPESKDRIKLLTGDSGKLGYDLIRDKGELKIKFLYEWLNCYSDEEVEAASKQIEKILLQAEGGELTLELLLELKKSCEIVSTDSEDFRNLVAPILSKTERLIEEDLNKKNSQKEADGLENKVNVERSKERLAVMLSKGIGKF